MSRERIQDRRPSEKIKFKCRGQGYIADIGYYPDGRIAELFLMAGKTGTDVDIAARDLGIAVSLALQHGCPIETIKHTCLQDEVTKKLEGVLGALFEALEKEKK